MLQVTNNIKSPKKVVTFIKRAAIATVLSLSSVAMGGVMTDHEVGTAKIQPSLVLCGGELRVAVVSTEAPLSNRPTLQTAVLVKPTSEASQQIGGSKFGGCYLDLIGGSATNRTSYIPPSVSTFSNLNDGISMGSEQPQLVVAKEPG